MRRLVWIPGSPMESECLLLFPPSHCGEMERQGRRKGREGHRGRERRERDGGRGREGKGERREGTETCGCLPCVFLKEGSSLYFIKLG